MLFLASPQEKWIASAIANTETEYESCQNRGKEVRLRLNGYAHISIHHVTSRDAGLTANTL